MENLKKIILTPDKGFVIEDSGEPIEIIGGIANIQTRTKNRDAYKDGVDLAGIKKTITDRASELPKEGAIGYVLQTSSELGEPINPDVRTLFTNFDIIKYKGKIPRQNIQAIKAKAYHEGQLSVATMASLRAAYVSLDETLEERIKELVAEIDSKCETLVDLDKENLGKVRPEVNAELLYAATKCQDLTDYIASQKSAKKE